MNTQRKLYNDAQGNLANADYYEKFANNVKAIKMYGADMVNYPTLLKMDEQ